MSIRNPELDEYQTAAQQTAKRFGGATESTLYAVVGLAGEVGEVAELVKKEARRDGVPPLDRERLSEELGDVLWYLARIASLYGLRMSDIARANIAKTRQRYPRGYEVKADLARAGVTFPELDEATSIAEDELAAEANYLPEEVLYIDERATTHG